MLSVRVLCVWLVHGLVRGCEVSKKTKENEKEPLHCDNLLLVKYKRGEEVLEAGVFDL